MSLWVFGFCHSLRSSAILCVSAVKLSFFLTTGGPAPGSGGGIIATTIQIEPLAVDAAGNYYFYAGIAGGKISEAIYVTK